MEAGLFAGQTLEGTTLSIEALEKRPVLVNFWATWCQPCVQELPILQRIADRYEDDGLAVVGINIDIEARQSAAQQMLRQASVRFPNFGDPDEIRARGYVSTGIPVSVLFDRQHKEVWRREGSIEDESDADLLAGLNAAFSSQSPSPPK
jgi:cytochrome c biogenesis protein CcmG/thiol:disulfide interchange protein DsbE